MSLALRQVGREYWSEASTTASGIADAAAERAPVRCTLLGVGTVGSALLRRWEGLAESGALDALRLVAVSDSRRLCSARDGLHARDAIARLAEAEPTPGFDPCAALGDHGTRIVIDATASDDVAARHAEWLARGIHVVTACKLGQGGPLARWRAIRDAATAGATRYGDAATVGAGLPLLRSIRGLRAGGDRIHSIAGVLSGSLGWLFSKYDGMRPFSALLHEARALGYTEPDPRDDLSGGDVRRKLLILARAAGFELEANQVEVESLVTSSLALLTRGEALEAFDLLDPVLRRRHQAADRHGRRLRFVARLDAQGARVGLDALEPDDPLAQGAGCDNRVAIRSDRYRERPLLIQGAGAGAEVTAAALLDDVLAIARRRY